MKLITLKQPRTRTLEGTQDKQIMTTFDKIKVNPHEIISFIPLPYGCILTTKRGGEIFVSDRFIDIQDMLGRGKSRIKIPLMVR